MKNEQLLLLNETCKNTLHEMERRVINCKNEVLMRTGISEEEFYEFYEIFKRENINTNMPKSLKYTYVTKKDVKIISEPFESFYIADTFIGYVNDATQKGLKCSVYKSHRCVDDSGEDFPLVYLCVHSDTELDVYEIDDVYTIFKKCDDDEMLTKIRNKIFG